jgi:hypothetical protein
MDTWTGDFRILINVEVNIARDSTVLDGCSVVSISVSTVLPKFFIVIQCRKNSRKILANRILISSSRSISREMEMLIKEL